MVAPYPKIDPRRAKKLVEKLESLVESYLPELKGTRENESSSRALIEIAGRLAGQVTQRMDKTPKRDVLAFFRELDVPQQSTRSAKTVLIFELSKKQNQFINIPARIQVAADTDDGEQLIFETTAGMNITPARLEYLAAVDTATDRIFEPPPKFLLLEPSEQFGPYQMESPAGMDSDTLQISPAVGLEEADVIEIDDTFYRIKQVKDGLITLHDSDHIKVEIRENTQVTKLVKFDSSRGLDLQNHTFYIGQAELFNLEQPSTIRLILNPSSSADRLLRLNPVFEIYGTKTEEEEPSWHKFDSQHVSSFNGEIVLTKDWSGKVEEVEIHEVKSRWLKVRLDKSENNQTDISVLVREIKLAVKSQVGMPAGQVEDKTSFLKILGDNQKNNETTTTNACIECTITGKEQIQTIKQAFYNATPLPVANGFLPFGSEPLRFDQFALAAPEALSKKGAKAALAINLVDATPAVMSMAQTAGQTKTAFAIGTNGRLQVLELNNKISNDNFNWKELDFPDVLASGEADETIAQPRLDQNRPPSAVELEANQYLVIVSDNKIRIWSAIVSKSQDQDGEFQPPNWQIIPSLPNSTKILNSVLVSKISTKSSIVEKISLLVITENGLYKLDFSNSGVIDGDWSGPDVLKDAVLTFSEDIRPKLEIVKSLDWPVLTSDEFIRLVLQDVSGKIYLGEIDWNSDGKKSKINSNWFKLVDSDDLDIELNPLVTPVAIQTSSQQLEIYGAEKDDFTLYGLTVKLGVPGLVSLLPITWVNDLNFTVQKHTVILYAPVNFHADSTAPFIVSFGESREENINPMIGLFSDGKHLTIPYPDIPRTALLPSALITPEDDGFVSLLTNGQGEKVYRRDIGPKYLEIRYKLFDLIETPGTQLDYVQLVNIDGSYEVVELQDKLAIQRIRYKAYALPHDKNRIENGQKYNLFRNFAKTFNGKIDNETEEHESQEHMTGTRFKLDPDDNQTNKHDISIITINSKLYFATKLGNANDTVILDGFLPNTVESGDAVIYQTSPLFIQPSITNQYPISFESRQIATLLETNFSKKGVAPLEEIVFFDSAKPDSQLIVESGGAGASDAGWLLLKDGWNVIPGSGIAFKLDGLQTNNWNEISFAGTEANPELSWEYYNGDGWRRLVEGFHDSTANLAISGTVCFDVPHDIAETEIAGQQDYWVRARLVGGDYGRARYINTTEIIQTPQNGQADIVGSQTLNPKERTTQTISVDTTRIRAPEVTAIKACFGSTEAVIPQSVLTENNRAVTDQSQANTSSSAQFALFEHASDIDKSIQADQQGRSLYFGFDKSHQVNPLTLLIDSDENNNEGDKLEDFDLIFEVLAEGEVWRKVSSEDHTHGFQYTGLLKLFINETLQRARLFGRDLYWMRIRQNNTYSSNSWAPRLNGIYVNAVLAEDAKTIEQEILGSSSGEPGQQFNLSKTPVVSNSLELRVRETLSEDEIIELRHKYNNFDNPNQLDQTIIMNYPEDQLIPGDWVLWRQVESFVGYGADDRVYQLDEDSCEVRFGDDVNGKIPPAGQDAIRAIQYQSGGGVRGNVQAYTITNLKSAVESVDQVTNPIAAAGGVDVLNVDQLIKTAPDRLRHSHQALTVRDIEALAVDWSPDIIRARCLQPQSPGDTITVFIVQRKTGHRCPQASLIDRIALADYLVEKSWGSLDNRSIVVKNPDYFHLNIEISVLVEASNKSTTVENEVRNRLLTLLHPTDGGVEGEGWAFGRRLWKSDLLRALTDIPGLDRVETIEIKPASQDKLSASSIICADKDNLEVIVTPANEGVIE